MKSSLYYLFLPFFACLFLSNASAQGIITTIAGTGTSGFSGDGGSATAAKIATPWSVATDSANNVYVADFANNRIRKIDASGIITTIAGTGTAGFSGDGGAATAAKLSGPYDVSVDKAGNVYVSDYYNNRVRRVNTSGIISTIAGNGSSTSSGDGGAATAAGINGPTAATIDPTTGNIYISANGTHIRKVAPSGIITTYAGTGTRGFSGDGGPASSAKLDNPVSTYADAAGNVYITDQLNERIRKVDPYGTITTIGGNGGMGYSGDGGPATAAKLSNPWGIATDGRGNIYIDDHDNNRIRKIDASGYISTLAGTGTAGFSGDGGPAGLAKLNSPWNIRTDSAGNVYIADGGNQRVRKVTIGNHAPKYVNGKKKTLSICQDAASMSIDTVLTVIDSDLYQAEVWSAVSAPLHGTLVLTGSKPTTGDTVRSTSSSYTPASGYSGADSFLVRVYDSYDADTIKIYVNILAKPATIAGSALVCATSTIQLSDATTGGAWSSNGTTIATVGTTGIVTGKTVGTAVISYTGPTGCLVTDTITVAPLPGAITGSLSICAGLTTTLSDGGGGTWSSGNTSIATIGSSSGVVNGLGAGTSVITYQFATGCAATANMTVQVSPAAITGNNTLCQGLSVVLSDTPTGGVWLSGNTSIATAGSTSGVITGVSGGTVTITYRLTGAGCEAIYPVTVYASPSAITGPLSVCAGSATTLSDGFPGGSWSSGNTVSATIGSPGIVNGLVAGTSAITYQLSTGCAATAIVTVQVSPAAITGNNSLCQGTSVILSDAPAGGTWLSGNTSIATAGSTSGVVSGISAGTAVITYRFSGSGCEAVYPVTVYASPSAITGVLNICTGMTSIFSDVVPGGSWSSGNTAIATIGSSSGVVTGSIAGTSAITYQLSNGCAAATNVTVLLLPAPIAGSNSVCRSSSIVLSDASTGGAWLSGSTSIATVGSTSGTVSGVAVGTVVITYRLGTTGCEVTYPVTVNAVPSPITGGFSVCAGLASVLSDASPGGVWSSALTAIATIGSSSGSVSGVAAGTAGITYAFPTGCMANVVVSVNASQAITGATSVCVGLTSALSNTTPGGVWTSGNTSVATVNSFFGLVSGVSPGTATISYTNTFGCGAAVTVAVNPAPSSIPGIAKQCVGASVTLSDATPGGVWSAGNTSVATVDSFSGVLSGLAPGTTSVTYTLSTGCAAVATAVVGARPNSITGALSMCLGTLSNLSDATSGGSWSSSNTAIATISSSGVVTGVASGTSVIMYQLAGIGCAALATVTIQSTPGSISGSGKICAGSISALSNAVPGGSWTSVNTAVATADPFTGQVYGISQGTATISYSLGSGCNSSIVVTVYPVAPVTGPSSVCAGQKISLSDAIPGGVWSSGATAIATVDPATGKVAGVSAGGATISYTSPSGCYSTQAVSVNNAVAAIAGPVGVCNGGAATFSDGSTGGVWSSSNTSVLKINIASGLANALTTGVSVITYSLGVGCEATAAVTVNPMPAPISGGARVCVGATLGLSDATTGGLWTVSATSVSVGLGTGIVTGLSGGTATISYMLGTGCGMAYVISVDTLPSTISGVNRACVGAVATLSDATAGGAWSTSGTVVTVGGGTGVVNTLSTGTAMITYTSAAGCVINSVFTVDPLPAAISGASGVCLGSSVFLTNATPGGLWSSGDTTIIKADATTGKMTGRAVGATTINYTLPAGCFVSTSLTVHGVAPIIGAAVVCPGNTISLTNAIAGGVWSSGATAMATAGSSTGIVTGVAAGTATIGYINPNGCASSHTVTVVPWLYPGVITGTSTACPGYVIALSDTVSGGVWSSANTNVYVPPTGGTARGVSVGTAVITYGVTNVCGTAMALHAITIFPTPGTRVIHAPDSVCEGTSTIAATSAPGGMWTTISSNITIGASTGLVNAISAGPANITYTFVDVCGAEVDIRAIKVNPLPLAGVIAGASRVCVGAVSLFTATEPGGVWSVSNTNAAVSSGLVSGVSAGTDTVLYTVTNSCGVADTFYRLTIDPLPDAGTLAGTDSVCMGVNTTIVSSMAGGSWTSGNTSIALIGSLTGIANGLSAGTVTLTYTLSTPCGTDQRTKLFKVNTLPDAGAIACADTLCVGGSTPLNSVVKGGVWSNKYNIIAAISGDTLMGVSMGVDTVVYTVADVCGRAMVTHPVYIAPSPWAGSIQAVGTLCVGNSFQLSNAAGGGVWAASDPNVAMVTNGTIVGVSTGIDTVFYSATNSCGTATTWVAIAVGTLPVLSPLSGSGSVCVGASISLSGSNNGGVWSCLDDKAMVTDSVVTGKTAGNTIIRYSAANECGTSYTDMPVYVDQVPSAGVLSVADSLCGGDSVSISASVGNGTWSVSNSGLLNIRSSHMVGLASGTDTVIYTVANACGSSSATHAVKVRSARECSGSGTVKHSFDCVGNGEVFIYPNPNPGLFTINVASDITENVTVEIFDMLGQKVATFIQQTNDPKEIRLYQAQGVYIVSIIGAHGHCSKHLVIDK